MKTTTSPAGRRAENEGYPIKVCELLSSLNAPFYLERVAVGDPKHNRKARAAVRRAIQNQVDNRGFSLVEVLSPCPTGWKMSPVEAAQYTVDSLTEVFPLGVFRDGHELDLGHPRSRMEVSLDEMPRLIGATDTGLDIDLPDYGTKIEEARVKIAGFGGQGVMLMGIILSSAGMLARRQVSWIPSYGPEMRGGTANCSVSIGEDEIGSPIVTAPTTLVAMNGPSLERFGGDVVPGGMIYYNSSMIGEPDKRPDVTYVAVPANEIADRLGNPKVANMVVLGAMLAAGCPVSRQAVMTALSDVVKSQPELLELNRRAIEAGMETVVPA
jgi:2-oxoisovalerate ferredoxin oxidoreductase beta subunit